MAIRLVDHAERFWKRVRSRTVGRGRGGMGAASGALPSRKGRAGQVDNDRQRRQCKRPFSWLGPTAGNRQAVALSLDE